MCNFGACDVFPFFRHIASLRALLQERTDIHNSLLKQYENDKQILYNAEDNLIDAEEEKRLLEKYAMGLEKKTKLAACERRLQNLRTKLNECQEQYNKMSQQVHEADHAKDLAQIQVAEVLTLESLLEEQATIDKLERQLAKQAVEEKAKRGKQCC